MTKDYRICRIEGAEPVIDLRSILRRVFGLSRPAKTLTLRLPEGSMCFAAIADGRMVGWITLHKPDAPANGESGWRPAVVALERLDVDVGHERLGCREALLDVALQCARASEYDELEVVVPAAQSGAADFYLANGFHIVGGTHGPVTEGMSIVLSLRLADARPHTDAWYSKHHGAWFASTAPH